MNKSRIVSKIKNVDIVCFDVFDTLLVRPYIKPTDLFRHMAKYFNEPLFADRRIEAENIARERTKKVDITLKDIYSEIDGRYKHFYKHELDWEFMVLRPNYEVYEIYKIATQLGKKIVIASDMYLPQDFISDVLKKNGFKDFDAIYVSGEQNVAKYNGSMFNAIIRDFNVKPSRILHIGDNKNSDYKIPCKLGIKAAKIERLVEKYINSEFRVSKFLSEHCDDLDASILVSLLAMYNQKNKKDNYWYDFGYKYAGPVIYGYTRWIESIALSEKLRHLLFVARDGYTLQKVFKTFNKTITNSYVYAPRFINLVYRLHFKKGNSPVAVAQQNTIIEYYCKKSKTLAKLYKEYDFKNNTPEDFLLSNMPKLNVLASSGFKLYKEYINEYILGQKNIKFGIVDTITENYSAQNLIQAAVSRSKNVVGLYWCAVASNDNAYRTFVDTHKNICPKFIANWGIMEFLMTSPEFPVEGISKNFKPVYKKDLYDDERFIRQVYPYVSEGAVDFAQFVTSIFDDKDIYLSYDCLVSWVNCFCFMPNKQDFYNVGRLRTSSNPNNNCYKGLFRDEFLKGYKIKHPFLYYKKMKSFMWHTPFEKFIVCLLHPVSLHVHGFSDVRICFFPKMKHKLFELSIFWGKKNRFNLVFGKRL